MMKMLLWLVVPRRWTFFTDQAQIEGLSGLDLEDGCGRMGIEENFFRGPIALHVFDRQEAGVL